MKKRKQRIPRRRYDSLNLLGCFLAIAVPEIAIGQVCAIETYPPSPVSVSAPSIIFTAHCTPGASSYSWTSSEGTCFGDTEADCDYATPGFTVVSVRADYAGGLSATDTIYLQVIEGERPTIVNPNQTITFGPAPNVTVGVTDLVYVTASSGLPVTLTSTTPLYCTAADKFVTGVGTGTCVITANQAGNFDYPPAPEAVESFGVLPSGSKLLSASQLGDGGGTLTSNPPGILCGADCSQIYAPTTNVSLSAAPFPGSRFDGWSPCVGTGDCAVAMVAATSVTARFTYTGSEASKNYAQKAYVAYYGRPADPAGQAYWAGRMDAEGGSLAAIVQAFGSSDEFLRRYGNWTTSQLVTRVYQQALGRDPDPVGLAFYVQSIDMGQRTLQSITLDVLNGAVTPPDSTVVANKLEVAAYYSAKVAAGCPYGREDYGVYLLSNVTAIPGSVTDAKAQIDASCASHPPI